VSYFGSALRLDEPEKRRSRALVLACSGWVPGTQPSVAPLRAVVQTLALGSLAVGRIRSTTRNSKMPWFLYPPTGYQPPFTHTPWSPGMP
jgi:hypothetical protein